MQLRVVAHQASFKIGDLSGNAKKIIQLYSESNCDLVVFPELCLTGYNCRDLFLDSYFISEIEKYILEIAKYVNDKALLIGAPTKEGGGLFNSAILLKNGKIENIYHKYFLPNDAVFDEKRYFQAGDKLSSIFQLNGYKMRIMICEDIWHSEAELYNPDEVCELAVIINASPYAINKTNKRKQLLKDFSRKYNYKYVIYVNLVGAEDHLVFDGGSMVLFDNQVINTTKWREGSITLYNEGVSSDFSGKYNLGSTRNLSIGNIHYNEEVSDIFNLNDEAASDIYNGIILALREYSNYAGCDQVVIGLSGGIDSALVAVIAVDAFGPEKVLCVAMPSKYSSQSSMNDASELVKRIGCQLEVIPINQIKSTFDSILQPTLDVLSDNELTNENLQPRIRATILMAIANKQQRLLLCTSNKSESAVGYSTLYGDMTGAYGPIVDIYKTQVYALCRWRNRLSDIIPETIMEKEPSAELRPNQKDSDSLPAYKCLDKILYHLIELREIPKGFDQLLVERVKSLLFKSEFKRFQSPPGPKVNSVMLSTDRRYPISIKLNFQ